MTPQEQEMLDGLITRIKGTQLQGKDSDAEQRIQQALGGNPDALYILCQTVLVQGYALEQAQRQLADVKQQGEQHPGFLEKIFGTSRSTPPASQQTQPPAQGYGAPVYAGNANAPGYGQPGYGQPQYGQPQYGQPQYGQPQYGYPPQQAGGGFGGGGFLQGALQTAAGVAMGEIAVQSLEGLMHGFGHAAGYGSDRALGGFGDDNSRSFADSRDSNDNFGDRLQAADNAGPGLSDDIEDRRGAQGFLDDGTNTDSQSFDDSDPGFNDDDSGSDFDNGSDDFSSSDDNS